MNIVVKNAPPDQRTIADMAIGEVAYTVKWAYDLDNSILDQDFLISSRWDGTYCLKIIKLKDGFEIDYELANRM